MKGGLRSGRSWWLPSWRSMGAPLEGRNLDCVRRSSRWDGQRFTNITPRVPTVKTVKRSHYLRYFLQGRQRRRPQGAVAVEKLSGEFFESARDLRVFWLGHSCILLELDGQRLLLDPMLSDRASPVRWGGPRRLVPYALALQDLPHVDAVLISHDHYDHLDYRSIVWLNGMAAKGLVGRFIVPLGVGDHLRHWGTPDSLITECDWWDEQRVGPVTITATPCRHFSGRWLNLSDRNQTLWCGWSLAGQRHRLFFSGDGAYCSAFRTIGERLGPFHLTMMEVGAYSPTWVDAHMGPEQALQAHRDVRGSVMLPVHWSTFDLALHGWSEPVERTLVAARAAGSFVYTPRLGQAITAKDLPDDISTAAGIPDSWSPSPDLQQRWWPKGAWDTAQTVPIVSTGLSEFSGSGSGSGAFPLGEKGP